MNYAQLGAGCIEYEWVGDRHASHPPLVLVHEGLGCTAMWGRFPKALSAATGTPVFAYSRFGYGGSDPLTATRTERFLHHEACSVLPELLAQVGIVAPVLLGQSDGASIALIYAATHPTSVAALVLEAPHVFAESLTIDGVRAIRERYRTDAAFRRSFGRYHRDAGQVVQQWSDAWLSPAFRSWTIEDLLARIICPVLLLQAEHDPYGSLAHLDRIASRVRGPVRSVVLPGSGHAPHRDCRIRVLHEISEFVSALAVR